MSSVCKRLSGAVATLAATALLFGAQPAGAQTSIVASERDFDGFGLPSMNAGGTIVFLGRRRGGVLSVYTSEGAGARVFADLSDGFDSISGAAIADNGRIVFKAFLTGGGDGLFFNADPPDVEEFNEDYPWRGGFGQVTISDGHLLSIDSFNGRIVEIDDPGKGIALTSNSQRPRPLVRSDINNGGVGVFVRHDVSQPGAPDVLVAARVISFPGGSTADIRDLTALAVTPTMLSLNDDGVIALMDENGEVVTTTIGGGTPVPIAAPYPIIANHVSINGDGVIAVTTDYVDDLGEYGDPGDSVPAIVAVDQGMVTKIIAQGDIVAGEFRLVGIGDLSNNGFGDGGRVVFIGVLEPIAGGDELEAILVTAGGNSPLPQPTPTPASDGFRWNNPNGGSFGVPTNWDPEGVPDGDDVALFDLPAAYSVNVGTRSVARLLVGGDPSIHVTFENSMLRVLTGSLETPGTVVDNGRFTLSGGDLSSTHTLIGGGAHTEVTAQGTIWGTQGRTAVGTGGEAMLSVVDSIVLSGETHVGNAANGAPGTVVVRGTSTWSPGNLAVGLLGPGTVRVQEGAFAEPDVVSLGRSPTGDGTVDVDGAGPTSRSELRAAQIIVGDLGGQGTLNVTNGALARTTDAGVIVGFLGAGQATVSGRNPASQEPSTLSVSPQSSMTVGFDAEGALTIGSGGRVEAAGVDIAISQPGLITVDGQFDGSPSLLEVGSTLLVGAVAPGSLTITSGGQVEAATVRIGGDTGGTGNVVVSGEGSGVLPSLLAARTLLAVGGENVDLNVVGGSGQLQVLEGATASAPSVEVGNTGPATLIIDGSGAGGPSGVLAEKVGIGFFDTGTVTVSNGGRFIVDDILGVRDGSRLDTRTGAVIIGTAEPLVGAVRIGAGGVLFGGGVIRGNVENLGGLDLFTGMVLPGTSPGVLTIEGDYLQGPNGVLEIEIAGDEAGTSHDVLSVTGDVGIEGLVLLTFIDGFAPRQGQQFDFLTMSGSADLSAATFEVRNLAPGFMFEVVPSAEGVMVTALNDGVFVPPPSPCAGDCNGDSAVTVDEIVTIVNIALGSVAPAACAAADLSEDGAVTVDEIVTAVSRALNGCSMV